MNQQPNCSTPFTTGRENEDEPTFNFFANFSSINFESSEARKLSSELARAADGDLNSSRSSDNIFKLDSNDESDTSFSSSETVIEKKPKNLQTLHSADPTLNYSTLHSIQVYARDEIASELFEETQSRRRQMKTKKIFFLEAKTEEEYPENEEILNADDLAVQRKLAEQQAENNFKKDYPELRQKAIDDWKSTLNVPPAGNPNK